MSLLKINIVYSFYDFCCCNQTVSTADSRRHVLLHLEHANDQSKAAIDLFIGAKLIILPYL